MKLSLKNLQKKYSFLYFGLTRVYLAKCLKQRLTQNFKKSLYLNNFLLKQNIYTKIKDYCITGRANVISCAVGLREIPI